jgi:hypothetical protein
VGEEDATGDKDKAAKAAERMATCMVSAGMSLEKLSALGNSM